MAIDFISEATHSNQKEVVKKSKILFNKQMKTTFELFRIKKRALQERFKSSIKAQRAFSRKDLLPIPIYSVGKVRSSTVCTSLLKSQMDATQHINKTKITSTAIDLV